MSSSLNPSLSLRSRSEFIIITSIVLLAVLVLQIINKRFWMHDFEVYYQAARAFAGGRQVYGQAFGLESGFYKYSPFALFLFLPLSLLPFGFAKVLFFLLISCATITSVLFCSKLLNVGRGNPLTFSNGILYLLLGIISSQVFRELHLGNINMLLLLLLLIILELILSGKQSAAGLLFSIVLFIKPHFIILLPLFFLRKYYTCLWVMLAGLVIGVLLTVMVSGVDGAIMLHKQWLLTMQIHNQSLLLAQDTIYSWLYRIMFHFIAPEASVFAKALPLLIIIAAAAIFGWFVVSNIRTERKLPQPDLQKHSFVTEFMLLTALVPNLVLTDSEHFLLSAPVILLLLGIIRQKRVSPWFSGLTVLAILLYGMNIHDLVGAAFSGWLTQNGILGFGNLMLISLTIFWFRKHEITVNKKAAII